LCLRKNQRNEVDFSVFIFTQSGTDVEHHLKQKRHVGVILFSIYENICLLVLAVLRLFG